MIISGHHIGKNPFIMAEVGLNHNGDIDRALEMVRIAHLAGCDAVKFQTFAASGVCDESQTYTYHSQGREITEPRINIFRRCELQKRRGQSSSANASAWASFLCPRRRILPTLTF